LIALAFLPVPVAINLRTTNKAERLNRCRDSRRAGWPIRRALIDDASARQSIWRGHGAVADKSR